jgi:GNAT superfamily N-acetyltransferase
VDPTLGRALAVGQKALRGAHTVRHHGRVPPTIATLAADPAPLTRPLTVAGTEFTFRALMAGDAAALAAFLAGLGDASREFWHGDADPVEQAAEWVGAIGRYDKLRLVVHRPGRPDRLDGMVDLSFSLPEGYEITRYARHGIALDPERTARFGPCVADARQGSGLAAALLPPTWDVVRLLGCDRVVLYGGVHAENVRAQRFYRRHGFVDVGPFDGGTDMMLDL